MVNRQHGLGRGLGALLSSPGPASSAEPSTIELPVDAIIPNPKQPRKDFDDKALRDLSESLKQSGLLQPVVVRRVGEGYQLVVGERRWRAAKMAGIERIPAVVREASDGDSVTIFTFDSDVRLHASTEIRGAARDDLVSIVDALEANGVRTHLGLAIQKGLDRAAALRAGGDKTRVQSVVLFTDGEEDVRGIPHPVPITANLDRVDGTYVFFVSMGEKEHERQLDEFARQAKNASVLRAPYTSSGVRCRAEIARKSSMPWT